MTMIFSYLKAYPHPDDTIVPLHTGRPPILNENGKRKLIENVVAQSMSACAATTDDLSFRNVFVETIKSGRSNRLVEVKVSESTLKKYRKAFGFSEINNNATIKANRRKESKPIVNILAVHRHRCLLGDNNLQSHQELTQQEPELKKQKTKTRCYGCSEFRLQSDPAWRKCSMCRARCCSSNACFQLMQRHEELHFDRINQ